MFASAPDKGGSSGSPTGDDPRYTSPARQREIEAEIKANLQNGRNAMRTVLAAQVDEPAAMRRADVGAIDFVWDRVNEKGQERGVKHILRRRKEQDEQRPGKNLLGPDETIDKIVEVIARGRARDTGNGWEIDHEGFRAVLSRARKQANAWLITGFQLWPGERRK